MLIDEYGYRVLTARTAAEATAAISDIHVDLVIAENAVGDDRCVRRRWPMSPGPGPFSNTSVATGSNRFGWGVRWSAVRKSHRTTISWHGSMSGRNTHFGLREFFWRAILPQAGQRLAKCGARLFEPMGSQRGLSP
jgi:hypothetical protein